MWRTTDPFVICCWNNASYFPGLSTDICALWSTEALVCLCFGPLICRLNSWFKTKPLILRKEIVLWMKVLLNWGQCFDFVESDLASFNLWYIVIWDYLGDFFQNITKLWENCGNLGTCIIFFFSSGISPCFKAGFLLGSCEDQQSLALTSWLLLI